MTDGGLELMKWTMSRVLTRPAFWVATAGQFVVATQICVAVQVALAPETSFRDQLWPSAATFAVLVTASTLFAPLLERAVLKDDHRLSDEQNASLELALRTGVLPLASLFADWAPALDRWRRNLVFGRWIAPILMAGLVALNVHDALIDPDGLWFYWISAASYVVLTVAGEVVGRRRIRGIRALEDQMRELRGRVPSPC
ncbi:hypothetical protein [Arthrobacter sp. H-02-3]|uniref:hypothetical protein n=1 Tax=Arthrobacter sp. H-02-3 TaxID=2703675 RepID=UPI000DD24BF8|nr:hypothetical protein [Arthrobacter sp. H-02-3]PVZ53706.1 hypothetical protein C9424_17400 [Arthrobacter sp. H-02-3]